MYINAINGIIKSIGNIADDLYTTEEEKYKLQLQEKTMEAELVKGQIEVNKQEAQHKSIFVAGWRPFIGWVGGISLAYQFLLYPLLCWALTIAKGYGIINNIVAAPPVFESGPLFAIITGMLGIGTMRTIDKAKRTQTDSIKTQIQKERHAVQ